MKVIHFILYCIVFAGLSSSAELIHHYTFDGADPFADSVGASDLTEQGSVGTITPDSGGFLSFSGTRTQSDSVYLFGDSLNKEFDPFILSLWFRTSNTENQSSYTSLFSSNEGTDAGFQIHLHNGYFGVNMNGTHLEVLPLSQLSSNEWHLVTLMQDPNATDQGQIWLDGNVYDSDTGSFGELNTFRLGVNRAGRQGFEGDIAEVTIYNGETWDSTRQTEAFLAGPAVPEPAVISLLAFSGLGLILGRRLILWGRDGTAG